MADRLTSSPHRSGHQGGNSTAASASGGIDGGRRSNKTPSSLPIGQRSRAGSSTEGFEVTHQQHLQSVNASSSSSPHRSSGPHRWAQMFKTKPHHPPSTRASSVVDNGSVVSDDSALSASTAQQRSIGSVEGVLSVQTTATARSHDTVKMSNRSTVEAPSEEEHVSKIPAKRWNKFKGRLMGSSKRKDDNGHDLTTPRLRTSMDRTRDDLQEDIRTRNGQIANKKAFSRSTNSSDNRPRFYSAESLRTPPRARSSPHTSAIQHATPSRVDQQHQAMLDQTIRGRFDGLDVLALDSTGWVTASAILSTPSARDQKTQPPASAKFRTSTSFTGRPVMQNSPSDQVRYMLWTSAGSATPEIVLDGFLPGGDDRWSVRIEGDRHMLLPKHTPTSSSNASSDGTFSATACYAEAIPALAPSDTDETTDDGGSPNWPTLKLWNTLWGSDPTPAHSAKLDDIILSALDNDKLLTLAAENCIPIDIDEDTFIVSNRDHWQVIRDIAAVPLEMGRFNEALSIFSKLLKGLEMVEDEELRSLLMASTLHNIGIVQLWQGRYEDALSSFTRASDLQKEVSMTHPDTVVSLMRQGMVLFALERFEDAVNVWMQALETCPSKVIARAKILNNVGVVQYHQRDPNAALKSFTAALEIYREYLEGPIRREGTVYAATTILGNMGQLYLERAEYGLVYYVYEESLLLLTTIFRKDHDLVLVSLTSLALAKARGGELKKAIEMLNSCLRSQNARFGPDSAEAMDTTGLLSCLYALDGDVSESQKRRARVRKWQKSHLPANHLAFKLTTDAAEVEDMASPVGTRFFL